ncbi:hypothetical protein BC567DRAFT_13635 [Phyllosticta citribraziliensis]
MKGRGRGKDRNPPFPACLVPRRRRSAALPSWMDSRVCAFWLRFSLLPCFFVAFYFSSIHLLLLPFALKIDNLYETNGCTAQQQQQEQQHTNRPHTLSTARQTDLFIIHFSLSVYRYSYNDDDFYSYFYYHYLSTPALRLPLRLPCRCGHPICCAGLLL